MALITCPECGKQISNYSKKCIYCGCPMRVIRRLFKKGIYYSQKEETVSEEARLSKETNANQNVSIKEPPITPNDLGSENISSDIDQNNEINENKENSISATAAEQKNNNSTQTHVFLNDDESGSQNNEELDFIIRVSEEEKNIISDFEKLIITKYPLIKSSITKKYCGFKKSNDNFYLFWFCFEDNKLVFKYRKKHSKESDLGVYKTIKTAQSLFDFISATLESFFEDNGIKTSHGTNDSDFKDTSRTSEISVLDDITMFFDKISISEKNFVETFDNLLKARYRKIESVETEDKLSYSLNGKLLFFFIYKDNRLLFFYSDNDRCVEHKFELKEGSANLFKYSLDLIAKASKSNGNSTSFSGNSSATPDSKIALLSYSYYIKKVIQGEKIDASNNVKELCEQVAEFVFNEAFHYAQKDGIIKDMETFLLVYRTRSYYKCHFFDRAFYVKYMSIDDAKYCFSYFVSSKIISAILKYETTLNLVIINDRRKALDYYHNSLLKGFLDFGLNPELTSNFSYVPLEYLEEVVSPYLIRK